MIVTGRMNGLDAMTRDRDKDRDRDDKDYGRDSYRWEQSRSRKRPSSLSAPRPARSSVPAAMKSVEGSSRRYVLGNLGVMCEQIFDRINFEHYWMSRESFP